VFVIPRESPSAQYNKKSDSNSKIWLLFYLPQMNKEKSTISCHLEEKTINQDVN